MIEDIIDVDTCDTCADTIEGHALQCTCVNVFAQVDAAQFVVAARTAVEEVDAYLRRVDAQVELPLLSVVVEAQILQVEGVAGKEPAPAQIGADLHLRVGRQRHLLPLLAGNGVLVQRVCRLHHHRQVVVLRFYVESVQTVESTYDALQQTHAESLLCTHQYQQKD